VNIHIRKANGGFVKVGIWYCYREKWVPFLAEVMFRAETASTLVSAACIAQVDMPMFLSVSGVFAHCLRCHLGKEDVRPCGLIKRGGVSFYSSVHHYMPRQPNALLLCFLDFCARFLDQLMCFFYCGAQKPAFGHFGHISSQVDDGLFQLYPTSWYCHSRRHVENLPEIRCCCTNKASAITSTLYDSVASSRVFNTCFVHSWRPISRK
jgi:hypothetical protein